MASGMFERMMAAAILSAAFGSFPVCGQDAIKTESGITNPVFPSAATPSTNADQRVLVEQLRSLLTPSDLVKRAKANRKALKPYYRIIPGVDGFSTLVYRCRYVEANKEMVNAMESAISSQGVVERTSESNMLTVHDRTEKMQELADLLMSLDIEAPQILVEVKVVEVNVGDGMQRSVNLKFNRSDKGETGTGNEYDLDSSAGSSLSVPGQAKADKGMNLDWFPYVSGNKNLQATLQWLMYGQRAKILSAPNVIVSRNATATITTGNEVPIQSSQITSGSISTSTTFKQVGVILEVKPKLINEDSVLISVQPQVSNISSYSRMINGTTTYEVPNFSVRKVESELRMNDGQVIMLGGLYTDEETMEEERIPFISDMPYIGEFFTSKNRSRKLMQLIFFLRVSIISSDDSLSAVIFDPGAQAQEIRDLGTAVSESNEIFPPMTGNNSTIDQVKQEFLERQKITKP